MDWAGWATRLKTHLKDQRLSQEVVAERMGLTQGAIAHWLNKRREINLSDYFRLCEAAGADAQAILFGDSPAVALDQLRGLLTEHPILRELIGQVPVPNEKVAKVLPQVKRVAHKRVSSKKGK